MKRLVLPNSPSKQLWLAGCCAALAACTAPYEDEILELVRREAFHPTMSCPEIYRDLGRTRFYLSELAGTAEAEVVSEQNSQTLDQLLLTLAPNANARADQQGLIALGDEIGRQYDASLRKNVERLSRNGASLLSAREANGC